MGEFVIAVHGGAGNLDREAISGERRIGFDRGLAVAVQAGQNVLARGGSAVNAVVAAVSALEDNPLFNAGQGAVLCADGSVEQSASVMRGRDLAAGAMVGLRRARNPVVAAHTLLDHSHAFLYGDAADRFAGAHGAVQVRQDYFKTDARRRQQARLAGSTEMTVDHSGAGMSQGTVGAVALDRRGHLAAATSTGGLVNQLPGRVGDTPVIGAGTWADNGSVAVSATGRGEMFIRTAFARRVADFVELAGLTGDEAARAALIQVKAIKGFGGCIVLDRDGNLALPFESKMMLRGWARGREAPHVGLLPGDDLTIADIR